MGWLSLLQGPVGVTPRPSSSKEVSHPVVIVRRKGRRKRQEAGEFPDLGSQGHICPGWVRQVSSLELGVSPWVSLRGLRVFFSSTWGSSLQATGYAGFLEECTFSHNQTPEVEGWFSSSTMTWP